ncbi:Phosphoglycerate kinase [Buchnera aphidicola (Cinara pseudotaxifoliae)]|uniref:Phosphoglycerate kinase n=1 Tax=Buchnera aphidicola (Cinara pseudotaxifoliae) TaxID=655384 RepID=A0A451DHI1_9GAMM|nr:phosphoglycerate kinase [Buchnera aphidicola]VFP86072.1 Phosphoglycerate kinase [Buchnera aphidicola (Cinara pseudotaxifoliae)]
MLHMQDVDLKNKRVFIRLDLNVPLHEGKITSSERIDRAIPTINLALKKNAKIIIASHLGRPKEGQCTKNFSLFPVFKYLQKKLSGINMIFLQNYLQGISLKSNQITVLENVRFNQGETQNNEELSQKYANLCDVFIMDAFATAHRIESSTYGICDFVKKSCIGPLLYSEITTLKRIFDKSKHPITTVIGGAKVSTKFKLLSSLLKITDNMLVGGGIANTFISTFYSVGKSLYEKDFQEKAKQLYKTKKIFLPIDSLVSTSYSITSKAQKKSVSNIMPYEEILDIGEKTIQNYIKTIQQAKTIIWNGPMGVFEFPNFRKGTQKIAQSIANSNAFSIAGGGDTIAVIDLFNLKNKISYISTGGGAFLEFIENKTLPILEKLKNQ